MTPHQRAFFILLMLGTLMVWVLVEALHATSNVDMPGIDIQIEWQQVIEQPPAQFPTDDWQRPIIWRNRI